MGDPLVGRPIYIGGAQRILKFTFKALRIAQKRFGGRTVNDLLNGLDVDVVCELAACGLVHEDSLASADRVETWLEADPTRFHDLSVAVLEAVTDAYRRMKPEEKKPSGEAPAPEGKGATTDGQTSTG